MINQEFLPLKLNQTLCPTGTCALMECTLCKAIVHPTCMTDYGVDGFIKMDLPNSWECPRCIKIREDAKAKEEEVKQEEGDQVDSPMQPPKVPKLQQVK